MLELSTLVSTLILKVDILVFA